MKLSESKIVFAIFFLFLIPKSFTLSMASVRSQINSSPTSDSLYFWKGDNLGNVFLVPKDTNVDAHKVFSIVDGVLIYDSKEQAYLRTKDEFENYKMHVEWRWATKDEKGNSGVLVHIQKPDSVWPKCMQVQLKKDNAGDLLAMSDAECEQTIGKPKETGAKFSPSNEKPGIEWNNCDIVCAGDSVKIYVNGLLQNIGTKMNIKSGAAALQLESRPIMFRNVYLIKQ